MMSKRPSVLFLCILFSATAAFGQAAQAGGERSTRISVLAFGDSYWVAGSSDEELEGRNGFWFRRIYLTLDQSLGSGLSARLRFEAAQPGDFTSGGSLDPFVKDAWLRWRRSEALEVTVGISPSPATEPLESFWGYRSLEKVPLDLYRMASSRDFGVALTGRVAEGRAHYHFMAGNGSGTGAETNEGKLVGLLAGFRPAEPLLVEVYAGMEQRPGETDRTTLQAFAGWRGSSHRIGASYATQSRERAAGGDLDLDVASAFAVWNVRPDLAAVLRVDRMFDPNPEADRIAYVPFDPRAGSTLVLAALDFEIHERIHLMPNVEWVSYQTEGGLDLDDEILPRITFTYSF